MFFPLFALRIVSNCLNNCLFPSASLGMPWIVFDLEWLGLDWLGLDWLGLDWLGLDWDWLRLDGIGLAGIGLDWIGSA